MRLIDKKDTVFRYLKSLPKGKTVTYKEVALACGLSSPRHVGHILQMNEDPDLVPCYKVILSSGHLARGYKFGGPEEQARRLREDQK